MHRTYRMFSAFFVFGKGIYETALFKWYAKSAIPEMCLMKNLL